jgi:hypothetical protein
VERLLEKINDRDAAREPHLMLADFRIARSESTNV